MDILKWHDASGKAQALARTAIAAIDHVSVRPQAMKHAQDMLDHLWAMGFRPSEGTGDEQ